MTNYLAYSTDVPADVAGKLMYGLEVTIIGVLIVFAVLALIMLVIYLFQGFFGGKKSAPSKPVEGTAEPVFHAAPVVSKPAAGAVNPDELVAAIAAATAMAEEELIVVLSAAVAAQEGCDPASSRYRIRSFRRIL
ncbi:MAG: OadG family protein [Clostridia bacterium]|nr:OadG family protein [Clostridia bacterium]MBQ4323224.1 OadG family protein [Clostridia bacterium]